MLKTMMVHTLAAVFVIGALTTVYQATVGGPSSVAGLWAAADNLDD
ncbi:MULTISPECIES: hypothetical protein [unclassified Azospirillum]|nr:MULTISPECIES: hypothetical protein [unclassified Azospirillum]